MTPGLPQVDPVPLAAPPIVFWLLLMLTLTLHVVLMNAVLGGSIIAAAARWLSADGDDHYARLARLIGRAMPVAIAAAVTLGVAALLFLQVLYGRVFFPSSVLMAWIWLAVVPLLIVAYYASYVLAADRGQTGVRPGSDQGQTGVRPGSNQRLTPVAVAAAAIFVVIAFIYANNMGLMLRVDALPALFARDARGLQMNTADPTMMPRYLHMLLGAIATAGLLVSVAGALMRSRDQAFGDWAIRRGTGWFAIATILNLAAGVWWLGVLPHGTIRHFLGGNAGATLVLAAGILVLLASLGLSFVGTRAARPAGWVFSAAGALAVGLVLMLLTRDFIRQEALDAAGFVLPTAIAPQWDLIAMFLFLFVAAIGLVAWMTRALVQGRGLAASGR